MVRRFWKCQRTFSDAFVLFIREIIKLVKIAHAAYNLFQLIFFEIAVINNNFIKGLTIAKHFKLTQYHVSEFSKTIICVREKMFCFNGIIQLFITLERCIILINRSDFQASMSYDSLISRWLPRNLVCSEKEKNRHPYLTKNVCNVYFGDN